MTNDIDVNHDVHGGVELMIVMLMIIIKGRTVDKFKMLRKNDGNDDDDDSWYDVDRDDNNNGDLIDDNNGPSFCNIQYKY